VPGLHGDEAWALTRSLAIAAGLRPLDGMNYYTGALAHYVLAFTGGVFGFSVATARVTSAAFNLVALIAIMRLVHRAHPISNAWLWTGLLTGTSATFVAFSRFAVDMSMLGPCLLFGGLAVIQSGWTGGQPSARRSAALVVGGAMLGLAIYNHMAAVGSVVGILAGLAVAFGPSLTRDRRLWLTVAGMIAGVAPRIVQFARAAATDSITARLAESTLGGAARDLVFLPGLIAGMLDGGFVFLRFTGAKVLPVIPVATASLVLLAILASVSRGIRLQRRDSALMVALTTTAVCIVMSAPYLALGYFEPLVLACPYVMVRLALACRDVADSTAPQAPVARFARRVGRAALPLIAASQLLYLSVDYFYSHRVSGGRLARFPLGGRVTETSNHFVRSDALYAELVQRGVTTVYAENLIVWPLEFYDHAAHRLKLVSINSDAPLPPGQGLAAFVAHNGVTTLGGPDVVDLRQQPTGTVDGVEFAVDRTFDAHFLVFVHDFRKGPLRD
jgi:hypothetical protein